MREVKRPEGICGGHESAEREAIAGLLKSLLVTIAGIPESSIVETASMEDELRMESVQLAQIQVAIEEQLDLSIDFLEILRLQKFGRIVDYVHGLIPRTET